MDYSTDTETVVVGFDFSGDDMLTGGLLSFDQGLTVLYGLNGTGKSRLLRGIRGALPGIQTDVNISLVARAVATPAVKVSHSLTARSPAGSGAADNPRSALRERVAAYRIDFRSALALCS